VFIANGAGDSLAASRFFGFVVARDGLPVCVQTIRWTAGDPLTDVSDPVNHRRAGRHLAQSIWAYHLANPHSRVCLLSHSTGAAVVLAAAECLPPGVVDRVILLAPLSSPWYDLRPALWRVREGIDVYFSSEDLVLDTVVPWVGTTDGVPGPAAGSVGFAQHIACPEDAALYAKLRQYAYGPAFFWTGSAGGHAGWLRLRFLRGYVVPAVLGTDRCALAHRPAAH
jgi:hypothetical protein